MTISWIGLLCFRPADDCDGLNIKHISIDNQIKNPLQYCIRKTFIYKWPQNLHGSSLNAKTFIKLGSEVI